MASPERAARRHKGPPLWLLAIVHTALFNAGLASVLIGSPAFPQPLASAGAIAAFFQARPEAARLCAMLQFGAAIPLGLYAATLSSRLVFLGIRAAGTQIALFGGIATAVDMMAAGLLLWALSWPVQDPATLYHLGYAFGGPGFSVPFGLLAAGIAVTGALGRLLPRWLWLPGLAIAAAGELSWLALLFPAAIPLIPLARFPGLIWLILVGFKLPDTRPDQTAGAPNAFIS